MPRRNVCFSFSVFVTPAGDGGPAVPRGSPSFPQGSPRRRETGLGPRPRLARPFGAATRPGIRGVRVTWPPPHPVPSLPRRKPVPPLVQFRSRRRARTRLPPPDPQRRALTELLCPSGPARLRFGSGSRPAAAPAWPCGPVARPGRRARPPASFRRSRGVPRRPASPAVPPPPARRSGCPGNGALAPRDPPSGERRAT